MSRRLTADSLPKLPVRFNCSSSFVAGGNVEILNDRPPKSRRAGIRIHPGYISDHVPVLTRYLLPDKTGYPRFRFYRLREPETKNSVTVHKNSLIDSYYPTIECDCSEDHESQKSHFAVPNLKESANLKSLKDVTHLQGRIKKPSIDSRTFTIYSCTSGNPSVHRTDNPQAEGPVDLDENDEALSGPECFSELHKRIEKLEEKLQQALIKSIQINDRTQKKSSSVQKLFRMVSGILERNGKPRAQQSFESDNSDTENEIRNIKKRLHDLEKKLKKEKNCSPRDYLQSTTTNSLLLKELVNDETSEGKIIKKESDYTEPLHSDTDSYFQKGFLLKNKNEVKKTFLSKCKILKRKSNSNKKISKASGECQDMEKECFSNEALNCKAKQLFLVPANLTDSRPQYNKCLEPEWKKKFRKKKKNNRNLCKKNPKMNIPTGEHKNVKATPNTQEWIVHQNQKCWVPCVCAECPYRDLSASLPLPSGSLVTSLRPSCEDSKTVNLLQKPLNFFKEESHTKTPVLLDEIIGKSKSSASNQKTPKILMRFVVTEGKKDPLTTLRNLVKKLSQTHTLEAKIQ